MKQVIVLFINNDLLINTCDIMRGMLSEITFKESKE